VKGCTIERKCGPIAVKCRLRKAFGFGRDRESW